MEIDDEQPQPSSPPPPPSSNVDLNHDLNLNLDVIVDTSIISPDLENVVSKIEIDPTSSPLYINNGNKTFILFIDKTNPSLMKLLHNHDIHTLNEQHKIFLINEVFLHSLITNILKTDGKFVYPLVFVNFIKSSLQTNKKIVFEPDMMLRLRVWANQLRNEHRHNKIRNSFSHNELFIGYRICCEMLYHYTFINKL